MKQVSRGFSLVELMIVIFVLGILAFVVYNNVSNSQNRSYYTRAESEFNTFANALKLYIAKYNEYPDDEDRNVPAGLKEFIAKTADTSQWPYAPWPGSVYDYDAWDIEDDGEVETYQISIRFCPEGGPLSACKFPNEPWAKDFKVNSAVYYCIKGNCRAHKQSPATYPGYCINCPGNKAIGT